MILAIPARLGSKRIKKKIFSINFYIVEIPLLKAFDLNTKRDWKNLIKLSALNER
tara:strand:- start:660 stop:824 length:165 start_codon:yes stop_codon:yes gene_type:complete